MSRSKLCFYNSLCFLNTHLWFTLFICESQGFFSCSWTFKSWRGLVKTLKEHTKFIFKSTGFFFFFGDDHRRKFSLDNLMSLVLSNFKNYDSKTYWTLFYFINKNIWYLRPWLWEEFGLNSSLINYLPSVIWASYFISPLFSAFSSVKCTS